MAPQRQQHRPDAPPARRQRWVLGALAVAAASFALSLVLATSLLPQGSANRDESTYVAMSLMLRDGRATLPAETHGAFRPWASGVVGDRIVPKYAPAWPAVLALAEVTTGSHRVAGAAMAAALVLAVFALTRRVTGDGASAFAAAAVAGLSPFVLVQGATSLPYLFQLVLELASAVLLLAWAQRRRPVLALAAGLAFGVAAFARPFDAVLVVGPFLAVTAWRHRSVLPWFAAGATPPVVALLAYNATVMGSPFRLPFTVTGSADRLGFGTRGVFPSETVPFSFVHGVQALGLSGAWLAVWLAGGPLALAAAVLGFRRLGPGPGRRALAILAIVVPLSLVPFWGSWALVHHWRGAASLGPFYHLPLLVPVAVFAGVGLAHLARRLPRWRTAGAALLAMATLVTVPPKIDVNRTATDRFEAAAAAVRRAEPPALLLLPDRGVRGFYSWTPAFQNSPDLDQPALYADDRDPAETFELLDRFPDRAVHRLLVEPTLERPRRFTLADVEVVRGEVVELEVSTRVPSGSQAPVLYVRHGGSHERRVLHGTKSTTVRFAAADADRPVGALAVGVAVRPRQGRPTAWEIRLPYRIVGDDVELVVPGRERRRIAGTWREADVSGIVELRDWRGLTPGRSAG